MPNVDAIGTLRLFTGYQSDFHTKQRMQLTALKIFKPECKGDFDQAP